MEIPDNETASAAQQLTPESPGWGTTFLPCPHVYLRLRLERAPSAASSTRDPAAMLDALAQALNVLHGAAGGAVRLTWMGFVHSGEDFVVRVAREDVETVRSACAALSSYDSQPCYFRVMVATPFLLSAARVDG